MFFVFQHCKDMENISKFQIFCSIFFLGNFFKSEYKIKSLVLNLYHVDIAVSFLGLLKEEDLHFRSHISDTQFTTEPICLHQGIATLFSSRIFQKSCGRRIRTSDLKVMSLASYQLLPFHDVIAVYKRVELFSPHRQ